MPQVVNKSTVLLAVIHPDAPSGIIKFWDTRWKYLFRMGIEMHFVVRKNANVRFNSIPSKYVHSESIHSPINGAVGFLRYLFSIHRDAKKISNLCETLNASAVISHGVQSVCESIIKDRKNLLFLHGNSLPRIIFALRLFFPKANSVFAELPIKSYPAMGWLFKNAYTLRPATSITKNRQIVGEQDQAPREILWIGNSSRNKNISELINNRQIMDYLANERLVLNLFFGDNQLPNAIKNKLASLSQNNELKVTVGEKRAWDKIDSNQVLALVSTSFNEGISNVIMESLLRGIPVISRLNDGASSILNALREQDPFSESYLSIYRNKDEMIEKVRRIKENNPKSERGKLISLSTIAFSNREACYYLAKNLTMSVETSSRI